MTILKDKYFIICVSTVLIFALAWSSLNFKEEDQDIKGIVFDVRESENGFVFYLESSQGKCQKCFFNEEPEELMVYSVSGNLSDDGNILFVKKMILLEYK